MKYRKLTLGLIGIFGSTLAISKADVVVDPMFSDHMVLQRNMALPIWGTADKDEKITVQFRGQTKSTTADADGKWMLKLAPLALGDAGELSVSGSANQVQFKDVLVGEVWLGSGQSNMAGNAGRYSKGDPVLAKMVADGPYPTLRIYTRQGWKPADEKVSNGFSALHFSFGLNLHQKLKIPVGLIVGAVGGTPSGMWLSEAMAEANPELMKLLKEKGGFSNLAELRAAHATNLEKWKIEAAKLKADGKKAPRFAGPIMIGSLYQRFIQPVAPYAIRGVLWDQGESKTQIPGVDQVTTMNALITGWRNVWGQGDFPFLHIQKPSGGGAAWDPENPVNHGGKEFNPTLPPITPLNLNAFAYPLSHIKIGTLKNAPLVTASDLGTGVHPANKSGYGKRASRVALGAAYGHDIAISGPTYKSHKIEGNKIRISFDNVGKGLAFRHADSVRGFKVSGKDEKWAWADAVIDGDTIVVSSTEVPMPTEVNYAANKDFSYANLFNKDGLPALMFTTVKWDK